MTATLQPTDGIEIERLGGLGGFGLPGSAIRSRAVLTVADLSAGEHQALAGLLGTGTAPASTAARGAADGFRYRVTHVRGSARHELEVPESALPQSLQERVKDELI